MWIKWVENKTFSDLKKYLKHNSFWNLIKIFEKTYYFEFNLEEDTIKFRNDVIDEFLLIIKEKID